MASCDSRGMAVAAQAFPLFPFFFFGEASSEVVSESDSELDDACFLFFFVLPPFFS